MTPLRETINWVLLGTPAVMHAIVNTRDELGVQPLTVCGSPSVSETFTDERGKIWCKVCSDRLSK